MRKKILLSIILLIAVSLLALSGCAGNSTTTTTTTEATTTASETTTTEAPATGLTAGRYEWKDPQADLETFIRFNDDGTYYAFFFGGGVIEAGTYELLDESIEYYINGGADEDFETVEDNETATAEQTVVLYNYSGGEQKIAYTEDELRDFSLGGMSNHQTMDHKADFEYDPANEQPVIVRQYYFGGEAGSNLILYHDKSFLDYTGDIGEEGTWVMNGDGSFTLTSADNGDAEYTLVGTETGAAYTKNGETIDLSATAGDQAVMVFMVEGLEGTGLPMAVDMHIDCMADGTVAAYVYVAAVDADLLVDSGTYTVEEVYKYTFNFETAGEIQGEPDFATATDSSLEVNVPYKADVVANFNGSETPLTIDAVLNGTVTVG